MVALGVHEPRLLDSGVCRAAAGLLRHAGAPARLRSTQSRPINQIVQLDHLTDIWTTLFFGTGVIWTAIGMRSALIFALGDRDAALQQGAFAMLERMIDGGILLALSTTIFGGVGGYVMRVYKTISLGTQLAAAVRQCRACRHLGDACQSAAHRTAPS